MGTLVGTTIWSRTVTDFPTPDMALTHILVVADVNRSRRWYTDVLGAELYREYGGTSAVLSFNGSWLLLVTGGGPTADKPTVTLTPPADADRLDHLFTIRVADCQAAYELLTGRGASFLAPPVASGSETRAFLRDPDGHLFEISEYRPRASAT
jgi:catechol 2,3-dioxygenase-like lactoylglutathione lyase family enzyme